MALIDLFTKNPSQLQDKRVQQIIAFAGTGRLEDGNQACREFREFLAAVPSSMIVDYVDHCLTGKFDGNGFALQDLINEVGRRLGFRIQSGRYRGAQRQIGYDGLWSSPSGHALIVEVKTTDAYRMTLDTVAGYRKELIKSGTVSEENSSILFVVGREDTGDFETQVRGSRFAWDIRLISVDGLLRLMRLKEELEDPHILKKIVEILIPREYTKVDEIIDIAFATAEDIQRETASELPAEDGRQKKFVPVSFHEGCVRRLQEHLGQGLIRRSRATFVSSDGTLGVLCLVSREHDYSGTAAYWFAFHPYQRNALKGFGTAFVALGCGSERTILLMPFRDFSSWVDGMNITKISDGFYWHVHVFKEDGRYILHRKRGADRIDLTKYLLTGKTTG